MKLIPVNDTAKAPAAAFTGDVYVTPIKKAQAPSRLIAALVRFTPGARTNWHSHANGQTLHVTEGVDDGDGTTWLEPVTDEQYAAAQQNS
ncbi:MULTISPECIES: cupin domain-containing protein [Amycolatopsis]|uniref:Cupin n=1 Tax=Amycolatopsis albidoflavus TaxID=102226 RepID=A0ABW5I9C9_9PSEU